MITINIIYSGENDNAIKFAQEMIASGIVDEIRKEEGNLRYEYFTSLENPNEILLIDSWENQEALDKHHDSNMMQKIFELREKYDLHMKVNRYISIDNNDSDNKFIRK